MTPVAKIYTDAATLLHKHWVGPNKPRWELDRAFGVCEALASVKRNPDDFHKATAGFRTVFQQCHTNSHSRSVYWMTGDSLRYAKKNGVLKRDLDRRIYALLFMAELAKDANV